MPEASAFERINGLLLERAIPSGRPRSVPLLFVHGMWGGSRPVPDLGRVSVLDYVQDVRDCLGQLGEVVLVGHSMGGLIAQKVAENGGVRAVVALTSAAPRGILVMRWPVLFRMVKYLGPVFGNRAFSASRADANALVLNQLSPDQQAWVHHRLVPESGRAGRELALGLIAVDETRVRCPFLVVGAQRDAITPVAVQRRIARKYRAHYLELERHGHMLMLEEGWERPFKEILAWIEAQVR